MATVLLPLIAGTWPPGYCPSTYQQLLDTVAANTNAQQEGGSFFNYGDTKPGPAYEGYPWIRTTDMRIYEFVGVWRSPNPETSTDVVRIFVGTEAAIDTYDGGSAGVVTPTSGPMWKKWAAGAGRFVLGVGTIPTSSPAAATAAELLTTDDIGGAGEYKHSLVPLEMQHMHGCGADPNDTGGSNDDPAVELARDWDTTPDDYVTARNDMSGTGGGGYVAGAAITDGAFSTTKAVTDPDFPTIDGHNNMPPWISVWYIVRTARQFYVVP